MVNFSIAYLPQKGQLENIHRYRFFFLLKFRKDYELTAGRKNANV